MRKWNGGKVEERNDMLCDPLRLNNDNDQLDDDRG